MNRFSCEKNINYVFIIIPLLIILSSPLYVSEAFAHGGGGDVAPPVSFKGKDVTVSTTFNPPDITVGEVDKATITVRFFDTVSNENIKDVTFQIELWKGEDLLARKTFYDDGWWADKLISDVDFAQGLEYLVENGVIQV